MEDFTHFNDSGRARMVDVSAKEETARTAVAFGRVLVNAGTFAPGENGQYVLTMPDQNVTIGSTLSPKLEGQGTEQEPYLIPDADSWRILQGYMKVDGDTAGMYFRQTGDFAIGAGDILGSGSGPFRGVYDGGGHTLTINAEKAPSSCAPFMNIENAVIRNLHVDGVIQTVGQYAAGLASGAYGTCEIINCRSSVDIESTWNGDGEMQRPDRRGDGGAHRSVRRGADCL